VSLRLSLSACHVESPSSSNGSRLSQHSERRKANDSVPKLETEQQRTHAQARKVISIGMGTKVTQGRFPEVDPSPRDINFHATSNYCNFVR